MHGSKLSKHKSLKENKINNNDVITLEGKIQIKNKFH